MRTRTTATVLLAAGITLAGCTSTSHHDATPTLSTGSTPATTTSTSSEPAKLSVKWLPKLDAHSKGDGDGTKACQQPSTTACIEALTGDLNLISDLIADINASNGQYAKTVAQANKMVMAAQKFDKEHCTGDPAADDGNSPCYGDAVTVTVGMSILQETLPADELDAG